MPLVSSPSLKIVCSQGSQVIPLGDETWHLETPPGAGGNYRLAQLDDYTGLHRRDFPWRPPLSMSLRARASAEDIPGTWGFGWWNDPFSLSLGFGGGTRRFPSLPNTAWFFHASPSNYLSLRDDLPAQGFLAASFQSRVMPVPILGLLSPGLVLFSLPVTARFVRRLARKIIRQDAAQIDSGKWGSPVEWRRYQIDWMPDSVSFLLDGEMFFKTSVSPRGPLALVVWIDNQYAALPPDGRLSFGSLPVMQPAWLEIADLKLSIP